MDLVFEVRGNCTWYCTYSRVLVPSARYWYAITVLRYMDSVSTQHIARYTRI